jgi:hypothetical protein
VTDALDRWLAGWAARRPFDEGTEYFLNCQFTREGAEEMKRGCERVVNSFQLE